MNMHCDNALYCDSSKWNMLNKLLCILAECKGDKKQLLKEILKQNQEKYASLIEGRAKEWSMKREQ